MSDEVDADRALYSGCVALTCERGSDPFTYIEHICAVVENLRGRSLSVVAKAATLIDVTQLLNLLDSPATSEFAIGLLGVISQAHSRTSDTFCTTNAFNAVTAFLFQKVQCEFEPARDTDLLLAAFALLIRNRVPTPIFEGRICADDFWDDLHPILLSEFSGAGRVLYLLVRQDRLHRELAQRVSNIVETSADQDLLSPVTSKRPSLKPRFPLIHMCCCQHIAEDIETSFFWWKVLGLVGARTELRDLAATSIERLFETDRSPASLRVLFEILSLLVDCQLRNEHLLRIVRLLADPDSRIATLVDRIFLQLSPDAMACFLEAAGVEDFCTMLVKQSLGQTTAVLELAMEIWVHVVQVVPLWNDDLVEVCRTAVNLKCSLAHAKAIVLYLDRQMKLSGHPGIADKFELDEWEELLDVLELNDADFEDG
jgi:hypothetical protein